MTTFFWHLNLMSMAYESGLAHQNSIVAKAFDNAIKKYGTEACMAATERYFQGGDND